MKNFLKEEEEAPAFTDLSWLESFNCYKLILQIQYSCHQFTSDGSSVSGSEVALGNLVLVSKVGEVFLHLLYYSGYFYISLFLKSPIDSDLIIATDFIVQ